MTMPVRIFFESTIPTAIIWRAAALLTGWISDALDLLQYKASIELDQYGAEPLSYIPSLNQS
jgi:hypothetical protein